MEKFLALYKELNADNLHLLQEVYSSDIHFADPAHELHGLDRITDYFSALYRNVNAIEFDFKDVVQQDNICYLQWDMAFSHNRLAGGKSIVVQGATFLRFNEERKACYHRDYFDLGAMLYEHLPLLGNLLTAIKRRLGT